MDAFLKHELRVVQWYRLWSELLVGLLQVPLKSYAIELTLDKREKKCLSRA